MPLRLLILTLGPPVIVAALYWSTMPRPAEGTARSFAEPDQADLLDSSDAPDVPAAAGSRELSLACRRMAEVLWPQLDADCRILIRPPYILAGDINQQELDRLYQETIVPAARALSVSYFDQQPYAPITMLVFQSERNYRRHAERIDGRQRANYSGYYQRDDRRIVLNLSTGNGTLAHELTHALAHFDFPRMPEWLDEGLASVHERSEFSQDGYQLIGVSNWRLQYILHAIRRNELQPTASLIQTGTVRPSREAVDYAHARYFCLYLQHRGLLAPFYRKFRASVDEDPTGLNTLQQLLGVDALDAVDREFREWVVTLGDSRGDAGR